LQKVSYKQKYTCYEKFLHSIYSNETKRLYTKNLKFFLKFCNFEKFDDLLELTDSEKYDAICDFLIFLREDRKIASTSVKPYYSAIKKFFKVNNVLLQWDELSRFRGKNEGKIIDDRLYTKQEILQLLDHADLREKVIIQILLSTGMRVGGLADLKIKDLEYLEEYKIYKITVYSYDKNERYVTFCTPECAITIDKYLQYRKEVEGDTNINNKPDSPLLYRKITLYAEGHKQHEMSIKNMFNEHMKSNSIQQQIARLQRKSRVTTIEKITDPSMVGKIRKEMMRCHSFRKIFNTTCIDNNVNHYVKEKLMGHRARLGLDVNYFRPSESQLLDEYLKVVNDLTINDENRLKMQNEELKTTLEQFNTFGQELAELKKYLGMDK
jgi:site-specific recombinase XerD